MPANIGSRLHFNAWHRKDRSGALPQAVEAIPGLKETVARALEVNPLTGGAPVRTLRSMNEEEIQALEKRYNCYCHRPSLSEEENTARRRAFKRSEP